MLRGWVGGVGSVSDTFEDAYRRVLEEMLALPARDLIRVNLRIIAARLLRLAGQRAPKPVTAAHAAEMRSRAFTLFITAYDQARRAIR